VGEMHDLFESYGGEDAYVRAISDDEDVRSPLYEKNKRRRAIREARLKANGGAYTKQDIAEIRARQHDTCAYCCANLDRGGDVDHIVPLSLGGSNGKENIQLACHGCNSIKGSCHPDKLFDDIKLFHLNRFRIGESLIVQNEILARIGVEGVRFALFNKWNFEYTRAFSENTVWRAKMRRKLKSATAISVGFDRRIDECDGPRPK
jgi:5-methylcytosine-specific restriction endonuclease McrA